MYKSIYIHIPFCHNICSYCDFCTMYYNKELVNNYLIALKKEYESYKTNNDINTIYIGGGTPSSLNSDQLDILFKIIDNLKLSDNYEFTFEINPEDISEELLIKLKNNRVNRISIGIETINDKFYKFLNRYNDKDELIEKINLCKKHFSNINIDLMYAFPEETLDDLKNDLDFFKELDIEHISTYSLIIEENTLIYNKNTEPISEELDRKMYDYIIKYLEDIGFIHYEISNFSKKGYESKHNLTYWNNEKYLGIGLGASGYLNNYRYTNTRSINKYLEGNYIYDKEKVSTRQQEEYEVMLGLRKVEGVSKEKFYTKFGKHIEDEFDIIDLVDKKIIEDKNGYIKIPKDKLYIENAILLNFIGDNDE